MHYNWHRHYDPSLGRYTQPDPLGFVDGPSVFAYAKNLPLRFVDARGLQSGAGSGGSGGNPNQCIYIPPPPGDCTTARHDELQNIVNLNCEIPHGCNGEADELGDLIIKRDRAFSCAEARTNINNECYRGGEPGHKEARRNAYRAWNWCNYLIDRYRYRYHY